MTISDLRRGLSAVLLLFPVTGCAGSDADGTAADPDPPADAAAAANVVEVTGQEFSYDAPMEIPSGWTTFRFSNLGAEPHHVTLMRLEDGHTTAEMMAALKERKPLEGIATAVGGPNAPAPGQPSTASMDLAPGSYVLACFIPSPDGVPHLFKGMIKPITVTGAVSAAVEPEADVTVALTDYAFTAPDEIPAGRRTFRVSNASTAVEPHEVILVRLPPGTTVEDVNDWIHAMSGPPPADFIGGVTLLDPGRSNTFTADLAPGEYGLLCVVPSVKDGEPHSMKGMMRQFTVE